LKKKGRIIHGLRILGTRKDIPYYIKEKKIEELIVAIPSLKKEDCSDILEVCRQFNIPCRVVARVMETEQWV
jgi:FlaA1/EpsC-like NDP-sugar epimerase